MSNTDVGGNVGRHGSDADGGGSPKETVAGAMQTVKQEAASFASEARDRAADKIEEQKQTASQTLGDFANAIRKAGDELADSDQSMATRVVRQAAEGLEGLARSVSDKRPEELLDAMRDFGQRNPTALIAGSVLAGIALGRFFKSSSTADGLAAGHSGTASRWESTTRTERTNGEEGALADPTSAGATSIGLPEAEFVGAQPETPIIGDAAAGDLDRDDIGVSGATDADRPRFGSGA